MIATRTQFADRATGTLPARILIVDDSAVARAVMTKVLAVNARFAVTGSVPTVKSALAFLLNNNVDVVLLDIEMPGIDGLSALPELLIAARGAHVLIVSTACEDGNAATIQALALGAADTLEKPGVGNPLARFSEALSEKLERLLEPKGSNVVTTRPPVDVAPTAGDFDLVAIGASTGGIHALSHLLRAIPASFQLPILITQHLPASFMPYFATQLAVLAGRPCVVATDHLRIRPGRIYIAPGDAHMVVVSIGDGAAIRLKTDPVANGCMPSVDPMFETVAKVFGARAMAVVLSGMGRDGSAGAEDVTKNGGSLLVQDQASSVVWGMPGAVIDRGIPAVIMTPQEIGVFLAKQRRP